MNIVKSQAIALRLMTWTNNFSKTFLIFASLIPFFRLIIPEKCFYQWILCHNFVYMKKFPWFLSFELGARQACDRRHRTMGTVHSGKISHLTWTFTKKYWAVLGCTGLYWAVLGHLRYLLGNVQVKWRILPLCNVWGQKLGPYMVQVVHEQTVVANGTGHVLPLDKVMQGWEWCVYGVSSLAGAIMCSAVCCMRLPV